MVRLIQTIEPRPAKRSAQSANCAGDNPWSETLSNGFAFSAALDDSKIMAQQSIEELLASSGMRALSKSSSSTDLDLSTQ